MCTFGVGRERTVGDSFHKELLIALEEELRASAHPMVHGDTARGVDTTCPVGKISALCMAGLFRPKPVGCDGPITRTRQLELRLPRCERFARCPLRCAPGREIQLQTETARNKRR